MAAAASTEVTLTYGQWTQLTIVNENGLITAQIQKGKLLFRYQVGNPGPSEVDGHEIFKTDKNRNIQFGANTAQPLWARPIYPAQDMVVTITKFG